MTKTYRHHEKHPTRVFPTLAVPPAPKLTKDDQCSECRVPAISIDQNQIKICPKCCAVLKDE